LRTWPPRGGQGCPAPGRPRSHGVTGNQDISASAPGARHREKKH
jgi:hypothetical protein